MIAPLLRHAADATVVCFQTQTCHTGLPTAPANQAALTTLLQLAFGVIGAVAVIIVIIAGLSMISAQGDPQRVANARSTIIYACIGLIIAISAEAIVTFTIGRL